MNDLGCILAWLALQVALVLLPAMMLSTLAGRRNPAAGAGVAGLSLVLVLILNAVTFLPGSGWGTGDGAGPIRSTPLSDDARPTEPATAVGRPTADHAPAAGWSLADLRRALNHVQRRAAAPTEQLRPWGAFVAVPALAVVGAGLIRLAIGLGAVAVCRRRGRIVQEPDLIALLDNLRDAIGYAGAVELREVPDLAGPATVGWLRPAILLPEDWRSWDLAERRAVLAHELAHIARGDYAAGLLARLAVALNGYHPLVVWTAGRLRLQQELAADAIGARYAGGRAGYLVALSRLTLRLDGGSPSWPARAFLPARGTLIRRIDMLRLDDETNKTDQPRRSPGRLAAIALIGLAATVAMLRGPARAGDRIPAAKTPGQSANWSLPPTYVGDEWEGFVAFRPSAAVRHAAILRGLPSLVLSQAMSELGGEKVDPLRKGFLAFDCDQIEWITCGLRFGLGKNDAGKQMHALMTGELTVRTIAPFDWLAYLRQWRFDFTEVRDQGNVYYRITGFWDKPLGPTPCVYLPDDRTIVLYGEDVIRKWIAHKGEAPPAYLRGEDWRHACQGVLAVAINNQGGAFAKHYDLGRPDDAVVLKLFQGVDRWIVSVADSDDMAVLASAACASDEASKAVSGMIGALVQQGRAILEGAQVDPKADSKEFLDRAMRIGRSLLANMHVDHRDREITVQTHGFGKVAEIVALIRDENQLETKEVPKGATR